MKVELGTATAPTLAVFCYGGTRNEAVGSQNLKADLMVISGIGGDLIKLRLAIVSFLPQRTRSV